MVSTEHRLARRESFKKNSSFYPVTNKNKERPMKVYLLLFFTLEVGKKIALENDGVECNKSSGHKTVPAMGRRLPRSPHNGAKYSNFRRICERCV